MVIGLQYITLYKLGGLRLILRYTYRVVLGLYHAPETWWSLVYITLHRPGGSVPPEGPAVSKKRGFLLLAIQL